MTQTLTRFGNNPIYYLFTGIYLFWTALVIAIGIGSLPGDIHIFTNQRSSMLPLISSSSLTVVVPQNNYQIGDIISYYQQQDDQELIITHRIYRLGGNVYLTKGDYNQAVDSEIVLPRHIIGRVRLIIPYLGSIFSFVKTLPGNLLLIIFPASLILIAELNRFRHS